MKTKTIYHLDENCNIVKIEKRTTLLGVVVRRKEVKQNNVKHYIDNWSEKVSKFLEARNN